MDDVKELMRELESLTHRLTAEQILELQHVRANRDEETKSRQAHMAAIDAHNAANLARDSESFEIYKRDIEDNIAHRAVIREQYIAQTALVARQCAALERIAAALECK